MMLRILVGILLVANVSAMQNSSEHQPASDQASRHLYYVMNRASCIINKTSLLGNEDGFDPSEKSLIPKVQSFLSQGADPKLQTCLYGAYGDWRKVWLSASYEYGACTKIKVPRNCEFIFCSKVKIK